MRVDQIGPRYGARKKPKRVGRGTGGKGGKPTPATISKRKL